MQELESIVAAALADFAGCVDSAALENVKARYLGKTGRLTELLKVAGETEYGPDAQIEAVMVHPPSRATG